VILLALACEAPDAGWAADPPAEAPPAAAGVDATAQAPLPSPFSTKHAYFVPSRFTDLPGWVNDNLSEAWRAFRQGCVALVSRFAWSGPCSRAGRVDPRADGAIREFLESEFALYEIRNADRSANGVITGYYEPLLQGNPRFDPKYPYPVYGVPGDLLYLDSRAIPAGGARVLARVDGRSVVPVCIETGSTPGCQAPYALDLGDAVPDIKDKKIRVRVEGNRIVPYYTRGEIEQGALAASTAIAWVDSAAMLYSMHVQGSGKIRMPDGQILRVAYGEQNGHPFTPPVRKTVRTRGIAPAPEVLMRGFEIPVADEGDELAAVAEIANPTGRPATRGLPPMAEPVGAAKAPDKGGKEELSPEVARMVDFLLHGTGGVANPQAGNASPAAVRPPRIEPEAKPGRPSEPLIVKFPGAARPSVWSSDPSYVFFRPIPDSDGGPLGALGVPLTPGRSIAVDPRTTPLGSPVFVSTDGALPDTRVNRLMFAQDTGGAIRGAVRADYFWGFGPSAYERASRMKETGRMWLLLPKDLRVAAATPGVLTRGIANRSDADEGECLVPDPELCVE
jgi:membrane-bound lytic murein transglycosylase A